MIQAERTPNPNSLKFTAATGQFSAGDVVAITSREEADQHPLGPPLLAIDGVTDVFITPEFVTVSKTEGADWPSLKGAVEDALTEYLEGE